MPRPSLTPSEFHKLVQPARSKYRLSEREVISQIVGTLKAPGFVRVEGWEPIRLQSGVVRGVTGGTFITLARNGTPDWICVRGGVGLSPTYFFFEAKAPGKELSNDQIEWHAFAERAGFPVIVADGLSSFIRQYRERGW